MHTVICNNPINNLDIEWDKEHRHGQGHLLGHGKEHVVMDMDIDLDMNSWTSTGTYAIYIHIYYVDQL